VPAADAGHVVVSSRVGGHRVLGLPSEEPGVEPGGVGGVGLAGVDPARHPSWVILARAHDGSLQRLSSSIPAASQLDLDRADVIAAPDGITHLRYPIKDDGCEPRRPCYTSARRASGSSWGPTDSRARVLRTTSVVRCWRKCWPPWWRR